MVIIGDSGNKGDGKAYEGTVMNDEGEPPIVVEVKLNVPDNTPSYSALLLAQ